MSAAPELSIIMPVFNEQDNLPNVISILNDKLPQWVTSYEIRLLQHRENKGPGSGIITGLANANGRLVTFIPADLAIAIDQFPKYLEAAKEAELVIGIRSDRSDYSFLRKINSFVYIGLVKLLFRMKQRQFNYVHLYQRRIFENLEVWSEGVFITAEIMIRGRDYGYKIKEVEIDYVPRTRGKASCGKPTIILKTFRDLSLFWILWQFNQHHRLEPRLRS